MRSAKMIGAHYPERSYKIFILNAPWWFSIVWKVMPRFLLGCYSSPFALEFGVVNVGNTNGKDRSASVSTFETLINALADDGKMGKMGVRAVMGVSG